MKKFLLLALILYGPLAVATISLPFDEFRKKVLKNKKEVEEKKMKQRCSASNTKKTGHFYDASI